MRINPVQYSFQRYDNSFAIKKSAAAKENNPLNNSNFLPLNNIYFAGKISAHIAHRNYTTLAELPLQEVIEHMEKNNQRIPERVEKAAKEVLAEGNPDKLTIYDVHKQAYQRLKDFDPADACALDKIKEEFPEFKDVISAYDIETRPTSALGLVNQGLTKDFREPGDAAVKFLQAYYVDLKSSEQISFMMGHTNKTGKTLFGNALLAFKQLNIPTYDIPYASLVRNVKRLAEINAKQP